MSSKFTERRSTMVIKSLEYPIYQRKKQGGLSGDVPKIKAFSNSNLGKSFEDYLREAFKGEMVQEGSWFSSDLTDRSKRNLRKL
jgi:hypothetical protein